MFSFGIYFTQNEQFFQLCSTFFSIFFNVSYFFVDFPSLRLFPKLFPPWLLRLSPPEPESTNHSTSPRFAANESAGPRFSPANEGQNSRFSVPPLFGLPRPFGITPTSHNGSSFPHSLTSALSSPSMTNPSPFVTASAWNSFSLQVRS